MTFKSAFFRTINYIKFKYYGIIFGHNLNVKYTLYIQKGYNSQIKIGDNFTFYSGGCLNPLGRNLKGCICTNENAKITIGNNVGISSSILWSHNSITIGHRVNIGANVTILDSDCHSLNYKDRGTNLDIKNTVRKSIVIEDDVLIGTNTIVLKGVTIGARSIIGSGSVITKDIPPDSIAAGNPCKIIKKINDTIK